jgi:Mitochondrial carrier protein
MKTLVEVSSEVGKGSLVSRIGQLLREVGVAYLYRSWPVALGRGLPGAAITLTTYDLVVDLLTTTQEAARAK